MFTVIWDFRGHIADILRHVLNYAKYNGETGNRLYKSSI